MWLFLFWSWLFPRFFADRSSFRSRGRPFIPAPICVLRTRKPAWVAEEVIRLKALMGDLGCRKVAATFNRLHAARHMTTISKSYVANVVRRHQLEVEAMRRAWKRRIPHATPINRLWGLDLTAKSDVGGNLHPIIGIVDHGSRLAVSLRVVERKTTIAVLRALLDAIERYGTPRSIRTDNDGAFTARLFGFAMWLLGIRHQRTEPHCPWQNGRIERFFGTLKERLGRWAVESREQLDLALEDLLCWYNHVRPHQHLHGLTPAEAWTGVDPYVMPSEEVIEFSAWDGALTGLYLRR